MESHDDIARLFRQIGHRPGDYREFGGAALPAPEETWAPLLLVPPQVDLSAPMPVEPPALTPTAPAAGNTPLRELFGRLAGAPRDSGLHGAT